MWVGSARIVVVVAMLLSLVSPAWAGDDEPERRSGVVLLRARLASPQIAAAAVSGLFFREPAEFDCSIFCDMGGLQVQAEAGLGGGSVGVGWASLVGERTRSQQLVRAVFLGFGARAVLLRTWGEANLDPPGRTYGGIEGAFTITQVRFTLGVYREISDS